MLRYIIVLLAIILVPAAVVYKYDLSFADVKKVRVSIAQADDSPIEVSKWVLDSGTKVLYTHVPDIPLVRTTVVFDAGRVRSNENLALADVTTMMLFEGSEGLPAKQLSKELEAIGARIGTTTALDGAYIEFNTLPATSVVNHATDLLAKALAEPLFDTKTLARVQSQAHQVLDQEAKTISTVASKSFCEALYPEHPYARRQFDSHTAVGSVTEDMIKRFYKKHYTQKNMTIAIVGAIKPAAARAMAQKIASSLPLGEELSPIIPATAPKSNGVQHVLFEGSAQTHIKAGFPFIQPGDEDYPALWVANAALGEVMLSNRLFFGIRDKGYAYSVHSSIYPRRGLGPFSISLATRNEDAAKALALTIDTYHSWLKNGITAQELERAKTYIRSSYWQEMASNSGIVSRLANLGFHNLPLNYPQELMSKVDSLTLEQVNETLARVFNDKDLIVVTVGPEPVKYG